MSSSDPLANAEQLLGRAKLAKEQAKDLRDAGDYRGAVEVLTRIVDEMGPFAPATEGASTASAIDLRLAAQLADCLGMLGGNLRRAGQLDAALQAFERGRRYEESARLQVASSYNLVNAITLPLESGGATPDGLAGPLRDAVAAIERQVDGERRRDRWAWADLGQCRLLLGDVDEGLRNYEHALVLGDDETMGSIVGVLKRLSAALNTSSPLAAERIDAAIGALGGTPG